MASSRTTARRALDEAANECVARGAATVGFSQNSSHLRGSVSPLGSIGAPQEYRIVRK
jgi:hypothetical protein